MRHFAFPEVFLGLFPAWGGTQLVPQLVGAEAAVKFVVENPLRQNRMLNAQQAFEGGYADALFEPGLRPARVDVPERPFALMPAVAQRATGSSTRRIHRRRP